MHRRPSDVPVGSHPLVSVSTRYSSEPPVVEVGGEIDLATAPILDRHLASLIGPGSPDVVIHLGRVTFMDASGLGVLIRADNLARVHGGRVRLAALPDRLARLLRITGLDGHFAHRAVRCEVGAAEPGRDGAAAAG